MTLNQIAPTEEEMINRDSSSEYPDFIINQILTEYWTSRD